MDTNQLTDEQKRIDISNLRFYASLFREHHWELREISWTVFEATLNQIAERLASRAPRAALTDDLRQAIHEAYWAAKPRENACDAIEAVLRVLAGRPAPANRTACSCAGHRTGECPIHHAPADESPLVPDGCNFSEISSRVCERGTGGCGIHHKRPAAGAPYDKTDDWEARQDAKKKEQPVDGDTQLKAERVKSRLLGIEDAISAFTDEALMAENKALIDAIDQEMVSCHLGVFNPGDDPRKAINSLMYWAQGVGEYLALHPIDEEDKTAWFKTPLMSSMTLTLRGERDANAILANRRARIAAPKTAVEPQYTETARPSVEPFVCSICGTDVIDTKRHTSWHKLRESMRDTMDGRGVDAGWARQSTH